MFSTQFWFVFVALAIPYFIVNILATKEIFSWIIEVRQRVVLLMVVWCLPFVGAFYTFRTIGSDVYGSAGDGTSGVSASLIGFDEIFNPNTKYVVEQQQSQYCDVREDKEPYKEDGVEEKVIPESEKITSKKPQK